MCHSRLFTLVLVCSSEKALEHKNRKPAVPSPGVLERRPVTGLASACFKASADLGEHLCTAHLLFFFYRNRFSLFYLGTFQLFCSPLYPPPAALLMLHRFYGVTERLNLAPLSAALSNYRFCRDTPPSKQPLCLIICDRKRIGKGTLVKLMWILSSSSEVNSLPF